MVLLVSLSFFEMRKKTPFIRSPGIADWSTVDCDASWGCYNADPYSALKAM